MKKTIKCPSCKGTKKSIFGGCLWCRKSGRVDYATAKRYADQSYMIAGGGYINGDHDLSDMRSMEADAEAIYASIGKRPPWKRSAQYVQERD